MVRNEVGKVARGQVLQGLTCHNEDFCFHPKCNVKSSRGLKQWLDGILWQM